MEAFAELGYEATSARELAKRLGVSHNFVNDRYGSKAGFWRAVVDAALAPDHRRRLELLDADTDDTERVRAVITHFYLATVEAPLLGQLINDEFRRESERTDHLYTHYLAPVMDRLVPVLDRLMAAGRIRRAPLDVVFFAVISPVVGLVQLPLAERLGRARPRTRESQERAARELAELVADGLLGRPVGDRE
jgi:TetR/AcrR family transcriptional regulator